MVIAHRGQGHDAPPKTIEEGPSSPAEPLQGVLFGEVDETQWGTKMLTPVCEERAQDLDREATFSAWCSLQHSEQSGCRGRKPSIF